MVLRAGRQVDVRIAPSSRPFDVDLGPLPAGNATGAVYSRCRVDDRDCDVYLLDLQTGDERLLTEVSTSSRSERHPSLRRNVIAFARSADGARDVVYVRYLDQERSRRQAVPAGRGRVLDTELGNGGNLAYVWSARSQGFGAQYLYRVMGDGRLERVIRAASGGANFARVLSPSWAYGALYFARTNAGSGMGNRIYRYVSGRGAYAAAPGTARYESVAYAGKNRFVVAESLGGECKVNANDPPERSACRLGRTDPLTFAGVDTPR